MPERRSILGLVYALLSVDQTPARDSLREDVHRRGQAPPLMRWVDLHVETVEDVFPIITRHSETRPTSQILSERGEDLEDGAIVLESVVEGVPGPPRPDERRTWGGL